MRLAITLVATCMLSVGSAALADGTGASPGYTFAGAWDKTWLRIYDRYGRPDPDGPLLQRFAAPMDRRYPIDLRTPAFPLDTELGWANERTGARMWVWSLRDLELANQLQLHTEMPTWDGGYIWLRYDRRQDWVTDRHAIRFDIGHRDVARTGVDLALRVHPGFEKDDIDLEGIVRYSAPGLGEARLTLGALDVFTNAAFGLIRAKGRQVDEEIWQLSPPLAVALDVRTAARAGIRAELYGGAVLPQTRRHRFPDAPERNQVRRQQALLGAVLAEWSAARPPLAIGATAQAVDAHMDWDPEQPPDPSDGGAAPIEPMSVRETTIALQGFALSRPLDALRLEGSVTRTTRPEWWWTGPGSADTRRDDREWLWSVRALWMPTDVVGADLQYLGLHRQSEGPPELNLDGRANRFVTRLMLELGDDVWTSFGVGWTPDGDTGIYDRAGMSLIYTPR